MVVLMMVIVDVCGEGESRSYGNLRSIKSSPSPVLRTGPDFLAPICFATVILTVSVVCHSFSRRIVTPSALTHTFLLVPLASACCRGSGMGMVLHRPCPLRHRRLNSGRMLLSLW